MLHWLAIKHPFRYSLWLLLCCGLLITNAQANSERVSSVRLETLGEYQLQESRRFVGRVDAISSVDLAFQVAGQIHQLPITPGQVIPRGQLVAALDPTDYQLALRRAQIQLDQARRDEERKRSLLGNNAIPRAVYEEAQDQLRLAEVGLEVAQRNLELTRIEAPFDALVARRLGENYNLVSSGHPVVRVQDVTELRVHISIPEDLIGRIDQAEHFSAELILPSSLQSADDTEQRIELEYREHVTEPDPIAQTYRVTLGFPRQASPDLLPGRTVSVVVRSQAVLEQQELTLPASALQTQADGQVYVWIYQSDSRQVSRRTVRVGQLTGERVRLISGVEPGEQVVTSGASRLQEGMRVRPFEQFN
ncbi:efflux RND transporter periplasmic adaptor subunit [Marinospirillum sp.]|uniref:efflux RND transporter periplasmic adaptor subunit n=1 Tax=Marinospirillum sp. TaxID=2183934 RepID=UPI003A8A8DD0